MSHYTRRKFVAGGLAGLILPQFRSAAQAGIGSRGIPKRVVYIGMGFGVSPQGWFPSGGSGNLRLPELLEPMKEHRNDISIIQNLSLLGKPSKQSPAHNSGLFFLNDATSVNDKASRNNSEPTCDQIAAEIIGKDTPFPSMSIAAIDKSGLKSGNGPGLRSISWNMEGHNISGINGAIGLYEAIYGNKKLSKVDLSAHFAQKRSVLDFLVQDIKSLNSTLSSADKKALDLYTSSLREVELNIGRSIAAAKQQNRLPNMERPDPEMDGVTEIKLTYELMALAMQTDISRVFSYMLPVDSILKSINAKVQSHAMSHYKGKDGIAAHRGRDKKNIELLAGFFDRLKSIPQPDGQSLFDHCMISFGGGLRYKHSRSNVPLLFAGGGGGGLRQGLNVVNTKNKTPLTNLWFSQLRQLDPKLESYNNSRNTVSEIFRT